MGSVIGQEAAHGTAKPALASPGAVPGAGDEVDPVDLDLASMVAVYSLMRAARHEPGVWQLHPVRETALTKVLAAVGGENGFTVRCDQHRLSAELVTVSVKYAANMAPQR